MPESTPDEVGDSTVTQARPVEPEARAGDETINGSGAAQELEREGSTNAGNIVEGIDIESVDVKKGIVSPAMSCNVLQCPAMSFRRKLYRLIPVASHCGTQATVWAVVPEVLKSEEASPEVLAGQRLDPRRSM